MSSVVMQHTCTASSNHKTVCLEVNNYIKFSYNGVADVWNTLPFDVCLASTVNIPKPGIRHLLVCTVGIFTYINMYINHTFFQFTLLLHADIKVT